VGLKDGDQRGANDIGVGRAALRGRRQRHS
jgi:hypothetical protein